jgi:protein-tyrosine phosphatase
MPNVGEPKMQQITEKLYQGDINDAVINSNNTNIDIIIYLGQEIPEKLCFNCTPACFHLPLNDGKNKLPKLRKIIFATYIASLENKLLITCRAGLSRSVLVATSIFALTNNISFDKAYWHIKEILPQSNPELNLFREIQQTTEELRCCL